MTSAKLQAAIDFGKAEGKLALYFGCRDRPGHYLFDVGGRHLWDNYPKSFPIEWRKLVDGGILGNGKVEDDYTGRVHWTCGGEAFWYAFCWWDNSVDHRGASNSGFYVRGFGWPEAREAFDYACAQFPSVVARQKHPLILQVRAPATA